MNSKVDTAVEKRVLDLLRKEAFVADLLEWSTLESITGSRYDLDAAFVPKGLEQTLDVIRLPERKLRSARSDDQQGLVLQPEYIPDCFERRSSVVCPGLFPQL
jgi:hypothetical protein